MKITSIEEFLEALVGSIAPETTATYAWYTSLTTKIREFAQTSAEFGASGLEEEKALKQYDEICHYALNAPTNVQDSQQIARLEERTKTLCRALMFFMDKEKSKDFTVTHEDLDRLRVLYEAVGVAECDEHGIHLEIYEFGDTPTNHVH